MLIFFLQLVLLFAIYTENSDKFLIIMGGDLKVWVIAGAIVVIL